MKRLLNLKVDEVSLAKKGKNNKKILLLKEYNGGFMKLEDLQKILESLEKTELAKEVGEAIEKAELDGQVKNAVMSALRMLTSVKEQVPAEIMQKLSAMAGIGYEEQAKEEPKPEEQKPEEPKQEVDPKEEAGVTGITKESLEKITKEMVESADKAVKPLYEKLFKEQEKAEKLEKENADIKQKIEKERIERLEKDTIKEVQENYKNVSGVEKEELGKAMFVLKENNKEVFEVVEKVLKSFETVAKESILMRELGSSAENVGVNDVYSRVEKEAKEIQGKNKGMSIEAARVEVFENNPKLYAEYNGIK